ncbi:MAG: helix-turn-helix domain-containing protein [Acetobacter sp.]|nr:helix-turn-helix domain-containing protein [Acetobacter sp.]
MSNGAQHGHRRVPDLSPEMREFIGQELRNCRDRIGLTRQQLAKQINSASSTLAGIERGDTAPSLGMFLDILYATDASESQVLSILRKDMHLRSGGAR